MSKKHSEHSIIEKVFRQTMTAAMSGMAAGVLGMLVDGIVIGNFLGVNALAAYGLVTPLMMIYALGGNSLAGGTRNLYTKLAGQGYTQEADNVFTLGLIVSFVMSFTLTALTLLFLYPLAAELGARGENAVLLPLTCQYLGGFVIGVAFEHAGKFIGAFMSIDSDNQRVITGTIVLSILSIAGSLVTVTLLNGSMLMLGLASSFGRIIYFFVMAAHFLRKDRMLHISLKGLTNAKDKLKTLLFNSTPAVISHISSAVGGIALYRIISSAASSVYIAAFSVYTSVERLTGISYIGIADTTWTMSSIYYGEEDQKALNTLQTTAILYGIFITMCIAVLLALFPEFVARLYLGANNTPQAVALAVEALRVLAFCVPLYLISCLFERYLMGTDKIKAANVYYFLFECGILIPSAYVTVKLMGGRGAWVAYPLTNIIMISLAVIYIHLWKVGDTFNIKRLLIGPEFGAEADRELNLSADTDLEVIGMSRLAGLFCKENGIDSRRANTLALCIEELGMNIIKHGFSDGKPHSIDMRMLVKDNELILRMRDDCRPFNPVERYRMSSVNEEDVTQNVGIRMVMKMSKDVQYLSTMSTNNLIIRI